MKLVIIGGHLAPALAVIDNLSKDTQVLFIGRKHTFEGDKAISLEYNTITARHVRFADIVAGRLQRKFTKHTIPSLLKIPCGFFQSFFILRAFKPDIVLGFGGYVSLPVILSSFILRIPIVIHEQTQGVGLCNRIVSLFAKKICISWESSRKFFPQNKTVLTGNPIRNFQLSIQRAPQDRLFNSQLPNKDLPIIYITGGSSGSHFINTMVEGCIKELLEQFIVIHQTGDSKSYQDFDRLKNLREVLSKILKSRYILKKFISPNDIGLVLQKADLVVARSGINTVTELIAFKKPAILIPIAFSQNNEQLKNALFFKSLGLGEVVTQEFLDKAHFLQKVKDMVNNINKYKIKDKSNALINKNAAQAIIEVVEYATKSKED